MDERINLPPINGVEGAIYDPSKSTDEQSDLAKFWAFTVRSSLPFNAELSVCEHSINGNQVRFPKKVWVYEGVKYIEETQFTHDRYHPQFFARKSAIVKVENHE